METRARRSIPISMLTYASNQAVRLIATVILARILVPKDFGLFALTSLAISLLSVFNDMGVGPALVVARDAGPRTRATALTLMIIASFVLAAVLIACSPLVADFFGEERLDELLIVIAGSLFLSGPIWFHETTLQRELEFGKRLATKLVQTFTYITVALTLAALGAGVWSLVIGHVASYVAYLVALISVASERVKPGWDGAVARRLAGSGRGFLAQDSLEYVQQQSDGFAIGAYLGAGQLGFYGMAYRFGELTYAGIADPVAQVTFPTFARMRERDQNWRTSFITVLRGIALVAFAIGVLLSGAAEPLVETLFGDKWLATIGPLSVLGIWAAVKPLESTFGALLNSLEQQTRLVLVRGLAAIPLVPGVIVAADRGGITTVAWVMLGHITLAATAVGLTLRSRAGVPARDLVRTIGPLAIGAAAAWAATRGIAVALDDAAPFVALVAAVTGGVAVYAATLSVIQPGLLPRTLRQALSTVRREQRRAEP